jgi:YHS domain-containing protein
MVLALAALAAGCGSSTPSPHPTPATSGTESALKPMGSAKIGDTTKCPVSGEEFTVTESSPKVEHDGKTYYFCCPGCDEKFKKDPAKYLDTK